MSHKKWYAATLVVTSSIDANVHNKPTVDLQVRLIQSDTAEEAYKEAIRLGLAEETNYKNIQGETVQWQFEGLHNLEELSAEELCSGAEVFSFRSGNTAEDLVVEKHQLTVFWAEANKRRKAIDVILDDE